MSDADTPIWASKSDALENWSTTPISDDALHYVLARPAHWHEDPTISENAMELEHTYRGQLTGEVLTISYMANADPNADMRGWVGGLLAITGTPNLAMWAGHENPPVLKEWLPRGGPDGLRTQLGLEELHCWDGFMSFPTESADCVRTYLIMGRREHQAWKVFLSIGSACLPGTPPEVIAQDDHVRASQIFGSLVLG